MSSQRLIFIEDDESFRTVIHNELGRAGYDIRSFANADTVVEEVRTFQPQVVLLDLRLPGASGLEVLKQVQATDPDVQVVILTGHGSVEDAVEAMRLGAYDFQTKPVRLDVLEQILTRANERWNLVSENRRLRAIAEASADETELLGVSPAMEQLRDLLRRIAPANDHVLVLGENGTGKELVARNLHLQSKRAQKPFLVVNCAAIPESLVESELFGHERGAFTGANRKRAGLFEAAHGGTLFLDEIGDMPMAVQPALLRAVQFGEIRPVGGERTQTVDVRVVAATNRDLVADVEERRFREDLYYRLSPLQIEIPPLRDRRDDIPLLAQVFLARSFSARERNLLLGDGALRRLQQHDWPGNVRELENAMTKIAVLCPHEQITAEDLDSIVFQRPRARNTDLPTLDLDELEHMAILAALERFDGDKRAAARELGVALKTLYNKISKYGLRDRYVQGPSETGRSG